MFFHKLFSASRTTEPQTGGTRLVAIHPVALSSSSDTAPSSTSPSLSSACIHRRISRRKSLGQGMTEYIVIVALVGVAAIGVYSFLGQSIRGATSGIALEIAGENADKGIKAAKDAADKAVSAAESKATLKNYNADNH